MAEAKEETQTLTETQSPPPAPARRSKRADTPAEVTADEGVPTDFAGAIYDAFTRQFGNQNPTQMFCLNWPGTVLNSEELGWEDDNMINGIPPEAQFIRSSQILDQYVPPSPITQPDGTRVSDRYKMAINQLAPLPNKHLAKIQQIIRERLNDTIEVEIDGKEKEITIVNYFYYLFGAWVREKEDWATRQQEAKARFEAKFPDDPNAQWDAYLAWYETNADSWIAKINAAYYKLLVQFPLTQWDDALAILDTKDDAGLTEAKELLRNARVPIPPKEGFAYYPTNGVPRTWANQLSPTTGFIDYLADPELQESTLDNALRLLQSEVAAWRAIIPQIDDNEVKKLAAKLDEASEAWRKTQQELIDTYTENAVTAVEIFVDIYSSRGTNLWSQEDGGSIAKQVNELTEALNTSNGMPGNKLDWEKIKEAAKKIGDGQKSLNAAQSAMTNAGMDLASAATEFLRSQGQNSSFTWLKTYIEKLETNCAEVERQIRNAGSASAKYARYLSSVKDTQGNPNLSPDFGSGAFPSKLTDPKASTWSEVKVSINQKQMKESRSLSTFFRETDWKVNLFLGSAGGSDQESGTSFATEFMSGESKIEMGFLATKVLIDRPWMKPEIFTHTKNMVRVMETPLSPKNPVDIKDISKVANQNQLLKLLDENSFPAYPVAVVLVKDLAVKVTLDAAKTKMARDTWDSKRTAGGGLFCFSVSETRAESSENESMSEYAMAGQMILRAPAPQIVGYFVQMVPPDNSQPLTDDVVKEISEAIGFLKDMQTVHESEPQSLENLKRPS